MLMNPEVNYVVRSGDDPCLVNAEKIKTHDVKFVSQPIDLIDARGMESDFKLDKHSFQFAIIPSKMPASELLAMETCPAGFDKPASFEHPFSKKYMEETTDYVRKIFDAEKVVAFDMKRRTRPPSNQSHTLPSSVDVPKDWVHNDYTWTGGFKIAKMCLTDAEMEKYFDGNNSQYRIRVVNFWRPCTTVKCWPFALADSNTIEVDDLISLPIRMAGDLTKSVSEIEAVQPNKRHKYYWLSDHAPDEVMIFKTWDSFDEMDKRSTGIHSSFASYLNFLDVPPRESIDFRCLVVHRV